MYDAYMLYDIYAIFKYTLYIVYMLYNTWRGNVTDPMNPLDKPDNTVKVPKANIG